MHSCVADIYLLNTILVPFAKIFLSLEREKMFSSTRWRNAFKPVLFTFEKLSLISRTNTKTEFERKHVNYYPFNISIPLHLKLITHLMTSFNWKSTLQENVMFIQAQQNKLTRGVVSTRSVEALYLVVSVLAF